MSYRVPPSDVLAVVISEALDEQPTVISQNRLTKIVLGKLRQIDREYAVTEERVRRVAIRYGLARVEIQMREADEKTSYSRCPVCASKMKRVRNTTIFGGIVTLGYKCPQCPYWTGINKRIPVRYVFVRGDQARLQREGNIAILS